MTRYGFMIGADEWKPLRDGLEVENSTGTGNVPLRLFREMAHGEFTGPGRSVQQLGYIVLTQSEAEALATELHRAVQASGRPA